MDRNQKANKDPSPGFKQSELDLIQKMFENAPVPMCILEGPEHRLRFMNKRFNRLYGEQNFPPGTPAKEILTDFKDSRKEAEDRLTMLDQVYSSGEPFMAKEFKTSFDPKGNGILQEGYFNLICQPLEDNSGKVLGVFITGYEVTEQVKARQKIARQEQRLRIALEGAQVGFWEVDAGTNTFDYVSDQFKAHFGRSPEEPFTYKDFIASVHPDDLPRVMEELKKAVEADRIYNIEYRTIWPDKTLHWILVRGQILKDEEGKPARRIGISVGITRQKEAERKLEEAIRLRDDFLSIASHELKTPVTSIKTRAELFERQLRDEGNRAYARQAGKINNYVDQLSRITGNLLDLSRLQRGALALEKEHFMLESLVREQVDRMQASTHHIIEVQGEPVQTLYADRKRIGQVLTSLLENAVKYSHEADRIIIRYRQEGDKAIVSVVDFGVGISKEDQQKVFQRFYKGRGGKKDTYPGFGIGLYISLRIVERHGGGIWVEDNPEGGSVFSFSLPVSGTENA